MTVGVRELKDNFSRYVREVERGKVVTVTAHGRVIAQLVPPGATLREHKRAPAQRLSRWNQMIADGRVQTPVEQGDPFEGDTFEPIVAPGSSAEWLDWSREDK